MDTTWKAQDCQTILNFSIGKNVYEILRYKDLITLKENKVKHEFSKITGDYSDKIASLLGFKALLTNRGESGISSPPPAYYFLPFYIDQKKSWSSAWDNF